jgi:hypothetical protein
MTCIYGLQKHNLMNIKGLILLINLAIYCYRKNDIF